MEKNTASYTSVDEYIAGFPAEVQEILLKIRQIIKTGAPQAREKISYQMPAYEQNGILVYFAAFKKHVSLFPGGGLLGVLEQEAAPYRKAKGTLQFPLNQPIPYDLIARIVAWRVQENMAKAVDKKRKK
jgi:uncharacterized protein YdhG (YjbR/CyaY superfamily)